MKIRMSFGCLAALSLAPLAAIAAPPSPAQPAAVAYCSQRLKPGGARDYCSAMLSGQPTTDYCAEINRDYGSSDQSLSLQCAEQELGSDVARKGQAFMALQTYANGVKGDEKALVMRKGIPCNVSSYTQGNHTFEEFWYCNGDGVQSESYTFLNGKLWSHFDAGSNP